MSLAIATTAASVAIRVKPCPSPSKKSVLDSVPTPQSRGSTNAGSDADVLPPTPSSMGSSTLSAVPNAREKEVGEILTMALEGHEKRDADGR